MNTVERCAGHDGTYGVKSEFYANSIKIGKPVFRQMGEGEPDFVARIARSRAAASCRASPNPARARARKEHPLTLLRIAYGL